LRDSGTAGIYIGKYSIPPSNICRSRKMCKRERGSGGMKNKKEERRQIREK
jgi:hypothetical protein